MVSLSLLGHILPSSFVTSTTSRPKITSNIFWLHGKQKKSPIIPQKKTVKLPYLPHDVLDIVIDCFTQYALHSNHPLSVLLSKQDLSACISTCRHWAKRCRPMAFRHITLRSCEDFARLEVMLQTPSTLNPSLSDCLGPTIHIVKSGPWTRPWFHRLQRLVFLMRKPPNICLEFSNPDNGPRPRSFSASLPVTLPGSVFRFQELKLDQWHFASVSDLLRLLRELPSLISFSGYRLHFGTFVIPQVVYPPRHRDRRSKLSSITLDRCSSPASEMQLMLMLLSAAASERLVLDNATWCNLTMIILEVIATDNNHQSYKTSCLEILGGS